MFIIDRMNATNLTVWKPNPGIASLQEIQFLQSSSMKDWHGRQTWYRWHTCNNFFFKKDKIECNHVFWCRTSDTYSIRIVNTTGHHHTSTLTLRRIIHILLTCIYYIPTNKPIQLSQIIFQSKIDEEFNSWWSPSKTH